MCAKHAKPQLCVIVCTYDRDILLDRCLASLCSQSLARDLFEVVVVDNWPSDGTLNTVARRQSSTTATIRYIPENRRGLSFARNRGHEAASAEYLVYVDDDDILPRTYLSNVLNVLRKHRPDILGGPMYPYYDRRKPRWFREGYETRKYEEVSRFSQRCRITGANFIIRRDLLKGLGMFDTNLGMKGNQIGVGEEAKVLDTYRKQTPPSQQGCTTPSSARCGTMWLPRRCRPVTS